MEVDMSKFNEFCYLHYCVNVNQVQTLEKLRLYLSENSNIFCFQLYKSSSSHFYHLRMIGDSLQNVVIDLVRMSYL